MRVFGLLTDHLTYVSGFLGTPNTFYTWRTQHFSKLATIPALHKYYKPSGILVLFLHKYINLYFLTLHEYFSTPLHKHTLSKSSDQTETKGCWHIVHSQVLSTSYYLQLTVSSNNSCLAFGSMTPYIVIGSGSPWIAPSLDWCLIFVAGYCRTYLAACLLTALVVSTSRSFSVIERKNLFHHILFHTQHSMANVSGINTVYLQHYLGNNQSLYSTNSMTPRLLN